jgi:transketolase
MSISLISKNVCIKVKQFTFWCKLKHMEDLEIIAFRSRILTILTAWKCGSGHLSSSLSLIEILVALFAKKYSNNNEKKVRIILSKGHAALGFYSVLSQFGLIDAKELKTYNMNDSRLGSHTSRKSLHDVEFSAGSLGMGLGFGCGLAQAEQINSTSNKIFVLLGDGECNEGSIWESANYAAANNLSNLVAIIDSNKVQAVARATDLLGDSTLGNTFSAFGWDVVEINGHNFKQIEQALAIKTTKPLAIVAHTVAGKSFPLFENQVSWHYSNPTDVDIQTYIQITGANKVAQDLIDLFQ